jgi:hypothetical protein
MISVILKNQNLKEHKYSTSSEVDINKNNLIFKDFEVI